ncbi:hypothetical protein AGLY_004066 [Aphis glycines]|uniref:Uncharacterized protein n=1 Tax=Aphis glycines TaxID=307491 RepID=A0A6G0TXX4_APHGL|nr:hypothetical protein AGLY_004066 [Aphis glycines]
MLKITLLNTQLPRSGNGSSGSPFWLSSMSSCKINMSLGVSVPWRLPKWILSGSMNIYIDFTKFYFLYDFCMSVIILKSCKNTCVFKNEVASGAKLDVVGTLRVVGSKIKIQNSFKLRKMTNCFVVLKFDTRQLNWNTYSSDRFVIILWRPDKLQTIVDASDSHSVPRRRRVRTSMCEFVL